MKTQTAIPEVLDYPTSSVNTIDLRIDKKEFDIFTEDCTCIIDEVEFVKIIDLKTNMSLPVVDTFRATTTATPRKGIHKFVSRIFNRLAVLPLTLPLCFLLVLGVGNVWGQILTFEFSALAGNEATANSNFNNSGLTSSIISRGAGLTAGANGGRYNASSWATTSIANAVSGNDYMEFKITPNSGKQFSVSSIVVKWQRSSTGNTQIALRSSVDNYASNLDAVKNVTDNTSTQTFTWTFAQANSSTAVTYRFYSYAESTSGTGGPGDGTGNDITVNGSVSDVATAPILTTPTVSSITTTSATLGATVTSNGGAALTSRGTVWGTSASPTGNSLAEGGTTIAAFTHSRTSLTANTFYYYRGYAINSAGTGYSADGTFTTLPLTPTVGTGNSITSSGFTANWSHPTMGSASYTYTIEVDDDNAFGSINSTVSSIASSNTSQAITGLAASTTYYYRVKAVNAQGSSDWSSTSAGVTTSAAVSPTLNPVTLSSSLTSTYGTPSTGVSFTASGSNLTSNITATAQSGYEVSTSSSSGYGASVSVTAGTTVFVRFASTISAGNKDNATAVVLSGGGASSSANVSTSSSGNTVSQKALTLTGLSAENKTYDGLTTATTTGTAVLSGVVGADAVSLTGTPTFTFDNATVGNSKTVNTIGYTLIGAQAANYTLTQPTFAANITVRSLTITANNVSKVQGALLSGGAGSTAFTSSGLQNSETIGSVTIAYGTAGATTGDGNTVGVYASQVTPSVATGGTFTASNYSISYVAGSITVLETPITLASWNFNGESSPATSTADVSNANLSSAPILSRGAGASASSASNSFRTAGFQNNGISTSNTDYFQTSFVSSLSSISFATIDAKFAGTASFCASPGVSHQFGYSLDGTNFTLISSSQVLIGTPQSLTQIDLSGISALQNVAAGTTITLRYYASGQTTTGGWGFTSATANSSDDGLVIQGYVKSAPQLSTPTATSITTNSAILGATITSDGGATITSRGTVYGTSASPTGNTLAEGGTSVAAFTHSRTGLTANTLYYYRGYAVNSVGTGYSTDGTFTTLHNAPTVGSESNATTTTIDASWTAPTGGSAIFTYEIEVDDNSDFSSPTFIQSGISSASTTITATGLTSNTTYYFRVRANNAGGSSAWSSSSSGYATLEAVSPTLSTTSLTAFGNVCLNVTSTANSFTINGSALTAADVTVSSLSGFTFSTTIGDSYTSSLSLPQAGGSYSQTIYVKFTPTAVQSYDGNIVVSGGGASTSENVAALGSGISGTVNVITTAASAISTTGASTGGTSVSTTCGTITAKGVAYATSANPTTPTTSDGTGTGNYTSTLSGLTPNTVYNYRAYATNSNGLTSYGSNLTFTTLHNAPMVGTGSLATTTGFTANWTAPTSGGSATFTYEVAVSTSPTFASTLLTQSGISSASTSYQFTGLGSGTTYYFRVRVNNSGGSSDWSAISSSISTQTVFENFETGSKTSYAAANFTSSAGSWNLDDAITATSVSDRKYGLQSIRIRNTGNATMNFDVTNGISSLTVYHALYGTDASSTWRLEVSNNAGSSWDAFVSSDITTSSTILTAQTFNVDLCGSLRFRIVKRNATARINFDDIVLVEKAATPSAPTASAQSFCSSISPTVADLTVTSGSSIKWYDAASNGNLLASETALSTGTYYASQTVSECESSTRTSVAVTINSNGTWIGDSNDDWNIAGNWCGGIPNSSLAVASVPTGVVVNLDTSPSVLNLTIGSGATINAGTYSINIADGGSITNNGTFNAQTSELIFTGAGTISGTTAMAINNLTLNGALTINSSPTVDGIVQLNNGASVLNSSIIYTANAYLYYNQSGSVSSSSFEWPTNNGPNKVAIYNGTNLSLNEDKSLNTNLSLANGRLTFGDYHLTLGESATITGTFSSNNMIVATGLGELRKRFAQGSGDIASFTFPVGNGGSVAEYTPIVLDFESGNYGANAYVGVRVQDSKQATLNSSVTNYLNRNWIVEPNDITGYSYKIQLYYVDADFITDGSMSEGDLKPIKISSGQWYQPTDGTFTNALSQGSAGIFASSNYLEWNNLTTFSEFGGAGGSNQPLPVELLSFNAICLEEQNILTWQTASEHNSSHFNIEKSRDGEIWNVIGKKEAAGNSNELLTYQFVDAEKNNSKIYYRLNQVDFDGKSEYFGPVTTDCDASNFEASTLPNPSNGNFWVKIQSNEASSAVLCIVDVKGNNLFSNEIIVQEGINLYQINSFLDTGIYFIHIYNSKDQKTTILKHLQN